MKRVIFILCLLRGCHSFFNAGDIFAQLLFCALMILELVGAKHVCVRHLSHQTSLRTTRPHWDKTQQPPIRNRHLGTKTSHIPTPLGSRPPHSSINWKHTIAHPLLPLALSNLSIVCFLFQVRGCVFAVVACSRRGAGPVGRAAVQHRFLDAGARSRGHQGGAFDSGRVLL